MRARSAPPLWLLLSVAVVVAGCLRWWGFVDAGISLDDGDGRPALLSFFGFLITIGTLIWRGLEVAGRVTLAALSWSVKALWLFATKTHNGLITLGRGVLTGLQKAWKFFELTYERVLKPAWQKFWNFFDKVRRWLDDTFGPVIEFLRDVRDGIIDFWKTWVRPWLDVIDVSRRILRILGSLGLRWAAELDRRLGAIQDAIETPFRLLLAKVNEVINVVNRIVTLDGLFQRVYLMRSVLRDAGLIVHGLANARSKALTNAEREEMRKQLKGRPLEQIIAEKREYFRTGGGPSQPLIAEMVLIARRALAR